MNKTLAKTALALPEMAIVAVEVMIQVYLLKFYTETFGLNPIIAGIVLSIAVFWDAVSDPLMGSISDRHLFFKRFSGRRRIYILLGSVSLAICFPVLFAQPFQLLNPVVDQIAKAGFLLFFYLAVNTAMTILSVPQTAFIAEIETSEEGRTKIFALKFLLANLGLLTGTILPGVLAEYTSKDLEKFYAAVVVGILLLISGLLAFFLTKPYDNGTAPVEDPASQKGNVIANLLKESREILVWNKPFRLLIIAVIIATVGRSINSSMALFYYEHFLKIPEEQVITRILSVLVLAMSLSVLLWIFIAQKIGKKNSIILGTLGLGLMSSFLYPFLPAKDFFWPIACAIFGGFTASVILLFESLIADMVDYDELRSKQRREGLYFGLFKFTAKVSRSLALIGAGFLLGLLKKNQEQPYQNIEWIFGPGVGLFFIVAAFFFYKIPWSSRKHGKAVVRLKKRVQAEPDRIKEFP